MFNGNGINGILKSDGEFIECQYGYFIMLAMNLPKDERDNIIVFSSMGNGVHGTAYKYSLEIGGFMSAEQFKWIWGNFEKMSINQKIMINNWLKLLNFKKYDELILQLRSV